MKGIAPSHKEVLVKGRSIRLFISYIASNHSRLTCLFPSCRSSLARSLPAAGVPTGIIEEIKRKKEAGWDSRELKKKKRGEKQGSKFERRRGEERRIKVKRCFPRRPSGTIEDFLGTAPVLYSYQQY